MVAQWAEQEMASADLGDRRLDGRAALVLAALGSRPNLSIPAACRGRAEMAAAYRFFDNDRVTFAGVLQPHVDRTLERMRAEPVVILAQDTTEVELARPASEVVGVGELDPARRGLLLHVMQAYTPAGTPLGTAWAQYVNRTGGLSTGSAAAKRAGRKQAPIEQKESVRWLEGHRQAARIAGQLPGVRCVCVGDSEADIYESLAEPRVAPEAWAADGPGEPDACDFLIRACQDRALDGDGGGLLRQAALASPVLYEVDLLVRGRQAKVDVDPRARRQGRETRQARVQVRAATVTLRPPRRPDRDLPPVTVNVVLVREGAPPTDGDVPVEWLLITTLPVATPEQVRQVVEYYCVRWNIEILFRTLKGGCRIEQRRFEHVERLLPAIAVYLIVAWRTMLVVRLGRECPDVDCELLFEPSEWKAVWSAVKRTEPPKTTPPLSTIVRMVAELGGYVSNATTEPGPQTVWIGLQRMRDLAWAWDAFGPEAKPTRKDV